jgi:hypothetical protein
VTLSFYLDNEKPDSGQWVAVETRMRLAPPYEKWHVRALYSLVTSTPTLVDLRVRPALGEVWPDDEDDEDLWNNFDVRARVSREVPNGITTRLLRAISLGDLERTVQEQLRHLLDGRWKDSTATRAVENKFKPGQHGRREDGYYAVWAKRYIDCLGTTTSPIADLARRHRLKPAQVRDRIREARVRGLLTETTRGRSGGTLTDKGLDALP